MKRRSINLALFGALLTAACATPVATKVSGDATSIAVPHLTTGTVHAGASREPGASNQPFASSSSGNSAAPATASPLASASAPATNLASSSPSSSTQPSASPSHGASSSPSASPSADASASASVTPASTSPAGSTGSALRLVSSGPSVAFPFALPTAIKLALPPTLTGNLSVAGTSGGLIVANNSGNLVANNSGSIISDAGGLATVHAGSLRLLSGTTVALSTAMGYLQIYYNTIGLVNAVLGALQTYHLGDVVTDGVNTYTLTLSGQNVIIAAYAGQQADAAHEILAASFSSSTKGFLIFKPTTIDAKSGRMVARADFDLAAGEFDDYVYQDASVNHPSGPGVRAISRFRFVAPPHPGPGDMIFKMDPSELLQDLSTGQWTSGEFAANFPAAGGAAFLLVAPAAIALPAVPYYMDASGFDVDAATAPAALTGVTPTSADFYHAFAPATPASLPDTDPAFQFPQ